MLDFKALQTGQTSVADLVRKVTHADLYTLTDEYFDTVQSIVAAATDANVTFLPNDPALQDSEEEGWPLSHVIVHLTATFEEAAASAAMLARGVELEGRLRYEVPWETVRTAQQIHARLAESRRMCRAFLDAWPAEPHLDLTITRIPRLGPLNAVGSHAVGLLHGNMHLEQLQEIMRQANT